MWLHLAWAILVVGACVALATTGSGGHPPAMILVPAVLLVGFLGHAAWLLIAWLLGKGRARFERAGVAAPPWPLELGSIAAALGLVVVGVSVAWGIAAAAGDATLRGAPQTSLTLAAIVAVHSVALVVLLLRLDSARFLIAAIGAGWALALALALDAPDSARASRAIAAAMVAGLVGLAVYVLRARRIRSVLR